MTIISDYSPFGKKFGKVGEPVPNSCYVVRVTNNDSRSGNRINVYLLVKTIYTSFFRTI